MEEIDELRDRVASLENELNTIGPYGRRRPSVRRRSTRMIFGMPLYDIALGPDLARGERRGHARGFFAVGDIATGVFALGGIARGMVAMGGVAVGAITFGGCSLGILLGLGGLATGFVALGGAAVGFLAIGGAAVGYAAVGGAAVGHYACGGGTWGTHVINGFQQDPRAVEFFRSLVPWLGPPPVVPPGK